MNASFKLKGVTSTCVVSSLPSRRKIMINTNRTTAGVGLLQSCECLHAPRDRRCMSWRCPMQLGHLTFTRTLLYVHARMDTVRRTRHIGDRHVDILAAILSAAFTCCTKAVVAHACAVGETRRTPPPSFLLGQIERSSCSNSERYSVRQPKCQRLDRTWDRAQISFRYRYFRHSISNIEIADRAFEFSALETFFC